MKKLLAFILSFYMTTISVHGQSVYELSFAFPHANISIPYKALLVDNNDGKAKLRLKFAYPAANDSVLVETDATEEIPDIKSGCYNSNRLYYRLANPRYIESKDPGVKLPALLYLQKDSTTGLFEPFGVANISADCKAEPERFTQVLFIGQQDLSKTFLLKYFKVYEPFYQRMFVTNNTKALTASERDVKMYLLLVANVDDEKIGLADRKNMMAAIAFFTKVQNFLGIREIVIDTITGKRLTKKNVEMALKTFYAPAGTNDILIFYFSGHGFRKPKDGREGPYIDLRDEKNRDYMVYSLSMEDIFQTIKRKNARLNLVLSDCCNGLVDQTNPMVEPPAEKKSFGLNWSTDNCRKLFLNATPMSVLGSAAEPYKLAAGNKRFGGFFSYFFRTAMETHFSYSKTNVTWEQVFKQTAEQTKYKANRTWCDEVAKRICDQTPIYRVIEGR